MKNKKSPRKKAIVKSKAKPKPEIYVKYETPGERHWRPWDYARAHIRVKAGKYVYLEWREVESIRSLYLGTRRAKTRKD